MPITHQLAGEAGFLIGAVSLLISLITLWPKEGEPSRKAVAICISIVGAALIVNYAYVKFIDKREYAEVPNVESLSYENAQLVLRQNGWTELPDMRQGVLGSDSRVIRQEPEAGLFAARGTQIRLILSNDNFTAPQPEAPNVSADSNTTEPLSLTITDYALTDSFHYEEPDPNLPGSNWIIDFQAGISGTFSYSRELTEQEKENWGHGGKLYDSNGNEIGVEGNYPRFWSGMNGMFAVEFPKNMAPGTYTYELYQVIDGQVVSNRIAFTI